MAESSSMGGQIIGAETLITLEELCRCCTVEVEEVVTLVREGILDPAGDSPDAAGVERWRFHIGSVRRVRMVRRLQRDLGVNLPGAALALELLDRIAKLERFPLHRL